MAVSEGAILSLGAVDESPAPAPDVPALTMIVRALALFAAEGLSVGLALGLVLFVGKLDAYVERNTLTAQKRGALLGLGFGLAGLFVLIAGVFALWHRRRAAAPRRLLRVAERLAPLSIAAFVPLLPHWQIWQGRELSFLCLVGLSSLCLDAALRAAVAAGPFRWELTLLRPFERVGAWLRVRFPVAVSAFPLVVVCVAALGYSAYFGYYTIQWHHSVRSGYDLALENNLVWNLLHGGQFFKSSPLVGPRGSHFGYHATLLAFFIAPFYALAPRPEALLLLQSTLLGFAAVPLFLFARLHLGAALSCLLAIGYLFYPGVHGANLYEYHYLPLGTFFLWLTLFALESKKNVLAVIAVILTLSVREDVSAALGIWGAYLVLTGRRPRAGLIVAAVSSIYFLTLKMVLMPRFAEAGQESFTFIYKLLLPAGQNSFGAVLKTVFGNPWFTVGTLLTTEKLHFVLLLFVPLAFVPLRRPISALFVLPGFLFTLLSTEYPPTLSIHYQYTAHWTTFLFVATVLVLASLDRQRRVAAAGALVFALLAMSYQYGSIFQHNTSFGGPIRYSFVMSDEDRLRRRSMDAVIAHLPPDGKVSCSAFTTPQVSSRPDAYSMTLGVYDADYLLFPTERQDFIVDEKTTVTRLLGSGEFGVVTMSPPFALARRGHPTDQNAALLERIR